MEFWLPWRKTLAEDLVARIRQNWMAVNEKIQKAADRSGRSLKDIHLIVVTKSQPMEVVRSALEAGISELGENYAEEGVEKINALREFSGVKWHMIGHVQSRKADLVARYFNMLHSLDSLKLAGKLERSLSEVGKILPVLLEFNIGGEQSKSGWTADDQVGWPTLAEELKPLFNFTHLGIRGLMTMPPLGSSMEQSRKYFIHLRNLQSYLKTTFPKIKWNELSMGTSWDYEIAVEEGATLVRVGQAILGSRLEM